MRATVEQAVERVGRGDMVVVAGPEGPAVIRAADRVEAASITFLAVEVRGLVCLALTPQRCDALGLGPMAPPEAGGRPGFTVSIEARHGVSTGISSADRARTIAVAVDPASRPHDLVQPGHVFPVRIRDGGLLEHHGINEAAVDLARMAGRLPAAVVCQLLDDDGALADATATARFCARHGLLLVDAGAVAEQRRLTAPLAERIAAASTVEAAERILADLALAR